MAAGPLVVQIKPMIPILLFSLDYGGIRGPDRILSEFIEADTGHSMKKKRASIVAVQSAGS